MDTLHQLHSSVAACTELPRAYQTALDWLYGFVKFGSARATLERMTRLLDRLGSPQESFPSIVIAGTKGKGSTAAMLANILRAAGYRTGLFTSPHLHSFRERMRVDEQFITREQIVRGVGRLQEVVPEISELTWFQLVTALAFEFFRDQKVEIAVLEVGLGGRLDATNVVRPLVSVITSISYDHTEILGKTLTSIAREKAGIIKSQTPIVMAPQTAEARVVLEATALAKDAPLLRIGRDWKFEMLIQNLDGQSFRVRGPDIAPHRYHLPLLGQHQIINATGALAAANELKRQGWQLRQHDLARGLASVEWPARFEILSRAPTMIADGAHNRASAHELAATLRELFPNAPIHLIFGASSDKDIAGMFEELLPLSASLILTQSHHVRAADVQLLATGAAPFHIPTYLEPSIDAAIQLARVRSAANPRGVICITGSLFVAAEARAIILKERGIQVETDED